MQNLKEMGDSINAQFRDLSGLHPGLWPILPRALLAVASLFLVVVLGWFFYWSGQLEEQEAGQVEEQKLKETFKQKYNRQLA